MRFNPLTDEQVDDLISEYGWRGVLAHADAPDGYDDGDVEERRGPAFPWLPSTHMANIKASVDATMEMLARLDAERAAK